MHDWEDVHEGVDWTENNPGVNTFTEPTSTTTPLIIIHSTGVFIHNVQWCHCPGSSVHQQHLHLLKARLFPASTSRPRTAFTFDVLDHFLIDALECKTSAMSFFQKLRRLTNNAFPDSVPDRYRELMRASRQWRDLMNRKRFGFGHDTEVNPGTGDLALFCAACPQPGINMPVDWQDHYESWLVMQRYVVDGNFTAQHMNMKQPHLDVTLSDGLGYMVTDADYQAHLSSAKETKEVNIYQRSSCSNHRAVNAANTNRSNLRATGVAATACARHGCFVPHTVVDFQKGERHMNVDYSICNAINYHSDNIETSLIIYDIGCQWCIHFKDRINNSPGLSLPEKSRILTGVGKFHLSAHKLPCFARFSLNFIEGAGQVDGEIMETLWAPFNKISPTARSMSQYHRQEILDDHMRDSNWKKMVGIVRTLLKKHKRAVKGIDDTKLPFDELTHTLDPEKIAIWEKDEKMAMELRGDHLDIYQLKIDKAPTMAEIRLTLTESETSDIERPGSIPWIIQGINLEDSQDGLRSDVRRLPHDATATQKAALQEKRLKLAVRIAKFHEIADQMMEGIELDWGTVHVDDPRFCMAEADEQAWEVSDEDDSELIDEEIPAEDMVIWMPSSLTHELANVLGLAKLQEEELALRKGQANDCLEKIRLALGQKAVIYRQYFRSADSVWTGTRSKQEAQRCSLKIEKLVRSYQRARSAMGRLGMDQQHLENIYQEILPEQLTVNKDVTEENRFGQGSDKLAWFWRVDGAHKSQQHAWMDEFYRVNWLKAKARWRRWEEELTLTRHEMRWTISWFHHQKSQWLRRSMEAMKSGHQAYGHRQVLLWQMFAEDAEDKFKDHML
ncbi:hypothetical protein F4604DRAFT_1572198 [Suillus subluteus]|nr:hypothetical protein F4604DRAFT_1600241 [Suillus subluteus]KAG1842619.1 hypothetical protein F4604DRAFT_1597320 [Suillus subluteus]KAG1843877.1 hypothetical protein F4604DRAFT_1596571 [Suillus subluteus]KAG1848483.1 hypothetical protein F4604DRAFT_1593939 [Suillus subluteus]KAG1883555.1 hypothetical protein F4604DRAFT_1575495 [Suillus subluteus]